MKYYLVYWEWAHGGRPAPSLVEAENEQEAQQKVKNEWHRQHPKAISVQGRAIYKITETDPSRWPVCSCRGWFVSDVHAHTCPAYGNTEGTWIVPTRPKGVF